MSRLAMRAMEEVVNYQLNVEVQPIVVIIQYATKVFVNVMLDTRETVLICKINLKIN